MRRFLIDFLIITILTIAGAVGVAKYALDIDVPVAFWICLGFIASLTLIIHTVLLKANQKRAQVFVNAFMAALTIKLLFSGVVLIAVGLIAKEQLVFTALGYLIAYVLYTVAEIRDLLPRMTN